MYLKKTALLGGLLLALVAISPLSLMADDDSEVKHRQMLMISSVIQRMFVAVVCLPISGIPITN